MTSTSTGYVPARFLALTAHLILTIVLYWAADANIRACMPPPTIYSQNSFNSLHTSLIVGVSISIGFFAFELIGFMGGISMFSPSQGMISLAAHASGAVSLALFLFNTWCSTTYWVIFAFTDALPFTTELLVWIGVLGLKKNL